MKQIFLYFCTLYITIYSIFKLVYNTSERISSQNKNLTGSLGKHMIMHGITTIYVHEHLHDEVTG